MLISHLTCHLRPTVYWRIARMNCFLKVCLYAQVNREVSEFACRGVAIVELRNLAVFLHYYVLGIRASVRYS